MPIIQEKPLNSRLKSRVCSGQFIKELKYTIKRISEELLESLRKQELETGDLVFKKMQIRKST